MYADYEYYTLSYLKGRKERIDREEFEYYSGQAADKMQYLAMGKITENMAERKEIKDCCCAMAEEICKYEKARENGSCAPVSSWSNDGESGSYSIENSEVTEKGHNAKIMEIARRFLLRVGLLNRRC